MFGAAMPCNRGNLGGRNQVIWMEPGDNLTNCLPVPAWVHDELLGSVTHRQSVTLRAIECPCQLTVHRRPDLVLVSAHAPNAISWNVEEFGNAVSEIYQLIHDTVAASTSPHLVRMWNFIPAIHGQMDAVLDRYQVFNQARYTAFAECLGGESRFPFILPTATGIGHGGDDVAIHAMATAQPGMPQENPRQVPAYRYSRLWGPRPPCFSRATIASMPTGRKLLIGGTASVRGEQSASTNSMIGQLEVLCDNLRALLAQLRREHIPSLELIRDIRVYYRRTLDRDDLLAVILEQFTGVRRIEMAQAEICRRELLVEIEAVADLGLTECPLTPDH